MASTPDNKQNIYKTVDARSERTRASSSKPYSKEETDSPRCEDKLDDKPACTPIAELQITEKGAARPTIRGRVISRTELKFYEHGHHKGSVFSIMVVDEASSSIRMVFFDKAADTYHGIIKEGLVFLFASVRVTAASSKYNPNAALEIKHSTNDLKHLQISPVQSGEPDIPRELPWQFKRLSEMFGSSSGFEGDTFGILWSCSELREVHINKTGHKKPKLTFNLIDDKSYERVTVWDDAARACAINPLMAQEHPLVALKAVRITEYDNQETGLTEKELTVGDHSKIEIGLDIDIPCLNEVRAWWNMQTRQLETEVVDLTSP